MKSTSAPSLRRRALRSALALFLTLGIAPAGGNGGIAPLDGQFQVNSDLFGPYFFVQNPAVAPRGDGEFVVVWHSRQNSYGVPDFILARRFAADGTAADNGTFVAGASGGGHYGTAVVYEPDVARGADGGFVVAYNYFYSYIGEFSDGVHGRTFDASGTQTGSFRGNLITDYQSVNAPALAAGAGGDFVVVWSQFQYPGQADDDGGGIFSRGGEAGSPLFQVNTTIAGDQDFPAAAGAPGGEMVVVWQSAGQDGSGLGVFAQLFDAAGNPTGAELALTETTQGDQGMPAVSRAPDGTFVAAWEDTSGGSSRVMARRFQADGAPLGGEFEVETERPGAQLAPSVAHDDRGAFVVTWTEVPEGGAPAKARARAFLPGGLPDGSGGAIAAAGSPGEGPTDVAATAGGTFAVVWREEGDPGSVHGRLLGTSLDAGLVSYWPFDDGPGSATARDHRGANDGTLVDMNPATAWVGGKFGGALSFAGDPQHVTFGAGSGLDVATGLTLAAWVRPADIAGIQAVFARGTTGGDGSFLLFSAHDFNDLHPDAPRAVLATADAAPGVVLRADPPAPLLAGAWHHLVLTYDTAGGTLRFYVDGTERATATDPLRRPVQIPAFELFAGAKPNLDQFFRGDLDDAALWHRALTATEVAELWNGGEGRSLGPVVDAIFQNGFESGDTTGWSRRVE